MIRRIFSRFENLNLLTLIHDLRTGNVLKGQWGNEWTRLGELYMSCPLSHGLPVWRVKVPSLDRIFYYLSISVKDGLDFIEWWDNPSRGDELILSRVLDDILRERQEDADAYQDLYFHWATSISWGSVGASVPG